MAPESPGSPTEQAYRQYLRSVKDAWADLDVEALDLKASTTSPVVPLGCGGTLGTIFCFPTLAGSGPFIAATPTQAAARTQVGPNFCVGTIFCAFSLAAEPPS